MNNHSARILVIDDEPINLELFKHALRKMGHSDFVLEQDPVKAIEIFERDRFDLVLLDYNMPGMSGAEVLATIGSQAKQAYIPIIVVTANSDRSTRLTMLSAGARDFLNKPIDIAELGVRLNNALEIRSLQLALQKKNDDLEIKVAERTQELHATRLEIINRLAMAAEFRDSDTGLHVKRMSAYAVCIGRRLGLSSHEADLLLNASAMHDVGKIGISDLLLFKPGKLTDDEFAEMRKHTLIGARILEGSDSDLLKMARDIALCHHEKWDGSGYPQGLSGPAIPLFARISSIADVFDALTTQRPYKKAWEVEKAFAYIGEQAGRHFDAEVVKAFLSEREAILAIRAANLGTDSQTGEARE